MRTLPLLMVVTLLLVALAGCLDGGDDATPGADRDAEPGGDEADDGSADNQTADDAPDNATERRAPASTTIHDFSVNRSGGEAPLDVEFRLAGGSPDNDSAWSIEFGDGDEMTGRAGDLPVHVQYRYQEPGDYTATATIDGPDDAPSRSVQVAVIEANEEPIEKEFAYGPSLGCLGDLVGTCISREQGPDAAPVDGFWQAFDARYWDRSFTSTVDNQREDSDCWAFDADMEPLQDDLNNGAGPCAGELPAGTAWLFLYSYGEPAPAMTLTFA